MKLNLNLRNKTWWKGLIISFVMLMMSVFFLVLSITFGEVMGIVVFGVCATFFGLIVVISLMPGQLASMQMVRGEMTPKQLEAAIAAEVFERPIRFLQKDFRPGLFLVSENWIVVEDHDNPVYVPKSKVHKIEMLTEPVVFGPELSGDGNTYMETEMYKLFGISSIDEEAEVYWDDIDRENTP